MLSASRFYADPHATWGYEPSFDGTLVAWWGTKRGRPTVFVGRTDNKAPKPFVSFAGSVVHFSWRCYENRLLLTEGDRLLEVDPINPDKRLDVTPQGLQSWQIIAEPSHADGRQAVISYDRTPAFADLFETHADGTGRRLLEENSGRTESWLVDADQQPCLRVERGDDGIRRYVVRLAGDRWNELAALRPDETLIVWRVDASATRYEALSNRGRDKLSLVCFDPSAHTETTIVGSEEVDVVDAIRFNPAEPTDLVVLRNGFPQLIPLSERGAALAELLGNAGRHVDFDITGASRDGNVIAASVSFDAQPPRPILYDLRSKSVVRLGKTPQALPAATTAPIEIPARDGEKLPGILTLPARSAGHMPAVVIAHGGPAKHDRWGFDRDRAFLASRGYAVLSVNYRGSTGFGKRFQALGFQQFGRTIQDDIADAAHFLIEEGIAAPGRLAIQGESFGGTIAALAMCRDPNLFAAAILDYPVLDLPFQMWNNPAAWALFTDQVEQYFGNPANSSDAAALREFSPTNQVARAHGAFLLTAGIADPIVGVEQTIRYEAALKKAGRPVTSLYFAGEGHGYTNWRSRLKRARAIELFLARFIGGEAKKFDWRTALANYWK
ncbi:alpha/beta hydrolase family protein [Rhizobium sp. BK377]|uniref:alpha/beta hydrolase family protein n=1 Tax=Rhizobium sp. BK377 TaxID=2587058 RepID=UPI00160D9D27|nr:alpha/beta fold hydrolase [Rhizobium sp. BK377]MBB3462907.1 dipeptidyl aminopeptidase/acylaminoacyl peptidase [Rhizobium sp. BK377]